MKRYWHFVLPTFIILLFSLVAGQKLFSPQFYTTHDGGGHVIRMEEFNLAFSDGQFPVRIAKRINYGLGYPFFHFNYPMVYYLGELLYRLGFTFVGGFKFLMFISLIAGSLGMYAYARYFFTTIPGVIVGLFYLFVPYRFLNMYVRGSVAEMAGLAVLPWVLFSTEYFLRTKKSTPFIVSLAVLVLTHNITALIGGIVISTYFLFRLMLVKKKERSGYLLRFFCAGITALLLTFFFWVPAIYDSRLTKLSELREDFRGHFPSLSELIYSPWGFGSWKEGTFPGKMSPQIGLIHLLAGAVGLVALGNRLIKVHKNRRNYKTIDHVAIFYIFMSAVLLFLSLGWSRPLWEAAPGLQAVQLPWRFVGYIVLCLSVIAGYAVSHLHRYQIAAAVILVGLALYANRNHIRVNMYIDHVSPFIESEVYGPSTTSKDEHMPRLAPRIYQAPNPDGDILPSDAGTSIREIWKSNYHFFSVDARLPLEFRDNTSFFPGWIAYIDGVRTPVLYERDEYRRLRVTVPEGEHQIEFRFTEPLSRQIVNAISLMTLGVFIAYTVMKGK
ncbi:MAG TPA: 6-pyruvoyl-tetrahydropterin synthase-related protein [Patescibacteria group bacterium]|nr:6-pyruvoyl-tetrahydropterin synthase-related protein [Patescibacteria group bacterium]